MRHDVLVFPDYRVANPYQTLLYANVDSGFNVQITADWQAALAQAADPIIFHLHWEDAIYRMAPDIDAIAAALPEDVVLYPQGERVEVSCPRCAAGDRYVKHDHLPAEEHRVVHGKLVVPGAWDLGDLAAELERATKAASGVSMAIPGLHEARGDTKMAGKHHKRWGAIARTSGR